MKILKAAEEIMLHLGVASSIACMILKILDWYNPFMDFEGHGAPIQWLLCVSVLVTALIRTIRKKRAS